MFQFHDLRNGFNCSSIFFSFFFSLFFISRNSRSFARFGTIAFLPLVTLEQYRLEGVARGAGAGKKVSQRRSKTLAEYRVGVE